MKDYLKVKGFGRVELKNAHTGEVEGYTNFENAVTNIGFNDFIVSGLSADLATGASISHGAIGSSTTAPAASDTGLNAEFETRKDLTGSLQSVGTLLNTWSYATNEATQSNVGEVGLFNASSSGKMFSHATFTASAKTTDQTLSVSYSIQFS